MDWTEFRKEWYPKVHKVRYELGHSLSGMPKAELSKFISTITTSALEHIMNDYVNKNLVNWSENVIEAVKYELPERIILELGEDNE